MQVADGHNTTAGELFEHVLDEIKEQEDEQSKSGSERRMTQAITDLNLARDMFALWLVSDLLGQLCRNVLLLLMQVLLIQVLFADLSLNQI